VTALARRPDRVEQRHERLKVVRGDVLDYASGEDAVRGQDAVFSALGHKRWIGPSHILSEGTRNVIRAMEKHGIRRLVCETSLGLGESWGRLGIYYTFFVIPFILPFYFWDKRRQESVIRASILDWIIVRPGALTNGPKRGACRHGARVGSWLWTVRISRADVADFMLNQLSDDTYLRSTPGVCW
ncbi:MAG: NAD(P)-dependent oxidoreductase, partial [Thermoanaerobaculia bacterium]